MYKQAKHTTITLTILGALAIMSGSLAMAGSVTLTNTFVAGEAATAASVNQNFTDVKTSVDDNDGRITTNTGDITTNSGDIATNTGAIGTNAADIATNVADIGANTSDIDAFDFDISMNSADIAANTTAIGDNETRITALEVGGGAGGADANHTVTVPGTFNCVAGTGMINGIAATATTLQELLDGIPGEFQAATFEVTISGTCMENIVIQRPRTTIKAATPGGAGITAFNNSLPTIRVNVTTGTKLINLVISGGSTGIFLPNGQRVSIIKQCTIQNSVIPGIPGDVDVGGGHGIILLNGARALIAGSTITGHPNSSVLAVNGSSVMLTGNNTITTGTGDDPIGLDLNGGSSALLRGTTTINGATGSALVAENGGHLSHDPSSGPLNITGGDLEVYGASTVFIGSGTQTLGFVEIRNGALLDIDTEDGSVNLSANNMRVSNGEVSLFEDIFPLSVSWTGEVRVEFGGSFDVQSDIGSDGVALTGSTIECGQNSQILLFGAAPTIFSTITTFKVSGQVITDGTVFLPDGSIIDDLFATGCFHGNIPDPA